MRTLSALPAVALIVFSACGAPRIDGRDADRARASIANVRRSVASEKQREFDSALRYLMERAAAVPTLGNPQVRAAIDGKSGDEIIAAARERRAVEDRKREEERLRQEKQAIDSTLAGIHQRDREASAKLGDIATAGSTTGSGTTSAGAKPEGLEGVAAALAALAGASTKYEGPVDDDVRSRCTMLASGRSDALNICLRQEMEGKRAVTGALPAGVEANVGQRVRENCLRKYGESYYLRRACENTDVGSINNVALHPEVMKTLLPERQKELHTLMGQ